MGRFGGIRTSFLSGALGAALLGLALAGCSNDKKVTPPAPSTTSTSSTTAVPGTSTSTSTTEATTVPTTTAPTSTGPATTAPSSVRISGFTVSPAAPVCNSPTEIQLSWTASGAATVDLAIDGQKFASYTGGPQSHLEYFACDGKSHTYALTAHGARGAIATASKVVRSTATG